MSLQVTSETPIGLVKRSDLKLLQASWKEFCILKKQGFLWELLNLDSFAGSYLSKEYRNTSSRDYRWGLGWWPDLLDSLIQRVTTLYSSSHITSSLPLLGSGLMADVPFHLGSRSTIVPQLPVSHINSSQRLNSSGPLTNSLTNQLLTFPSNISARTTQKTPLLSWFLWPAA
jgi:hypothetical protein